MRIKTLILLASVPALTITCNQPTRENPELKSQSQSFPSELVEFSLAVPDPIFEGTGVDTWDSKIRERGYILKEDNIYKMWYSGHTGKPDHTIFLGYATSSDGIQWERHADNPVFDEYWTEDVHITKDGDTYYMVAEGVDDIAHLLSSGDGLHWSRQGDLDIRKVNGDPIEPGAYGTPTLWVEEGKWHLFYERSDSAIWLATTSDMGIWTNVQDSPVIKKGPGKYDSQGVALNQIIRYKERYYAYYHGTPDDDWASWNSNVAVSDDLIHWTKYEGNPIVDTDEVSNNYSSPILVHDGDKYRLYTMHESVRVYFPTN